MQLTRLSLHHLLRSCQIEKESDLREGTKDSEITISSSVDLAMEEAQVARTLRTNSTLL
jgi:hypothetical protein